jgi:copper chaperone CopZ
MSSTTPSSIVTTRYRVVGMTCDHCVMAVQREVSSVPGVRGVTVTLATGDVAVGHDRPLDRAQVAAAIDEAGYRLDD